MNKTFEVYSQEEIDKWVLKMYCDYVCNSTKDIVKAITSRKYRYTICCNLKTGNIGKSKRHSKDEYNVRVGIAYAYARSMDIPEPKLVEKTYCLEECIGKTVEIANIRFYIVGYSSNKDTVVAEKEDNRTLIFLYSSDKVKSSQIKY